MTVAVIRDDVSTCRWRTQSLVTVSSVRPTDVTRDAQRINNAVRYWTDSVADVSQQSRRRHKHIAVGGRR